MADLGPIGALPTGQIIQVVNPTATTTGTAKSYQFGVQATPTGKDRTLVLAAQGASAFPTTLTANLEVSFDGGTTWQIYKASLALVATTAGTAAIVTNVVAGPLYRTNQTTVTIGSAVTYTIYAVVN